MSFIQNQLLKTGRATGNAEISVSPNYTQLTLAVEGVGVTVRVVPHGLTNPQDVDDIAVVGDSPAIFNIVPSDKVILVPANNTTEFSYSLGQL